jgi:hypothetical protein
MINFIFPLAASQHQTSNAFFFALRHVYTFSRLFFSVLLPFMGIVNIAREMREQHRKIKTSFRVNMPHGLYHFSANSHGLRFTSTQT